MRELLKGIFITRKTQIDEEMKDFTSGVCELVQTYKYTWMLERTSGPPVPTQPEGAI